MRSPRRSSSSHLSGGFGFSFINLIGISLALVLFFLPTLTHGRQDVKPENPDGTRAGDDELPEDYNIPEPPETPWHEIPFFPGYNESSPVECSIDNCAYMKYPSSHVWAPRWVHGFRSINAAEILRGCPRDSHARAVCLGKSTEKERLNHQFVMVDTFITPEGVQGIGFALPGISDLMSTNLLQQTTCVVRHQGNVFEVLAQWEFIKGFGLRGFSFQCPMRFPSPVHDVVLELHGPLLSLEPVVPVMPPVGHADSEWWAWPRREPGQPQLRGLTYKAKNPTAHPNSIAAAPLRIAGCAGNLFHVDVRVLIQWIEFHRLVGVSVFVLYALFSTQPMWSDLIAAYANDPEITVIVVSFSQALKFRGIGNFQQHIASMHCRMLLRGLADHVILFDVDELIVPTTPKPQYLPLNAHPKEWVSLPRDVLSWEREMGKGDRLHAIFRPINFFGTCMTEGLESFDGVGMLETSGLSSNSTPVVRFGIEFLRQRCNNMLWWFDESKYSTIPTKQQSSWPLATRNAVCGNNLKMIVDVLLPFIMRTTHELRDSYARPLRAISPDGWLLHHYRNVTAHWPCGYASTETGRLNLHAYPAEKGVSEFTSQHISCFGLKRKKTVKAGFSIKEHACRSVTDSRILDYTSVMKQNVKQSNPLMSLWQKAHSLAYRN